MISSAIVVVCAIRKPFISLEYLLYHTFLAVIIEKPPIGSVTVIFEVKIVTAKSEQHNKRRKEWNC
ncbi:hypothetical protein ETEC_4477 [Escherichia coli ETEC H10407]|nr:hypothetical protein ETEC_4477 [Escherichia coli ETEC H10407]